MTMASQIVAKIVLVCPHAFLAFGPESSCDLALVVFFYVKVLVVHELHVRQEWDPTLPFAQGVGYDGWVEGFEVGDEAGELERRGFFRAEIFA
jgi:hypothetical protein